MRSTPTDPRKPTSAGRMKLAPTWHCRAQYSLGFSDIFEITSLPQTYSWEPTALVMRSQK
jgi:hypothetical protein